MLTAETVAPDTGDLRRRAPTGSVGLPYTLLPALTLSRKVGNN